LLKFKKHLRHLATKRKRKKNNRSTWVPIDGRVVRGALGV
jgi:hypothetical protein